MRKMGHWALAVVLAAWGLPGCTAMLGQREPAIYDYNRQEYDQLVALENSARQSPTSADAVMAYADALVNLSDSLRVNLGREDLLRRVQESNRQLEGIVPSLSPDRAAKALLLQLAFFRASGDNTGAERVARQAFQTQPSYQTGGALLGMLTVRGARDQDGVDTCAKTHELALAENVSDEDLAKLLEACLAVLPAGMTREEAYPSISSDTWESFDQYLVARGEARAAAWEAEREQDAQRQASVPSAADSTSGSSASAEPSSVSIRLRNECPNTVRLFYGDKPKFGSGTSSSIGSNHLENHTFRPGNMVWIVDEAGNGVSSWSASPGAREVSITRSCTSFAVR